MPNSVAPVHPAPGLGRRVDAARLFPSACLITGRGEGPFVDLMKDFTPENTGRMYIRERAVRDLALLIGMREPEELAQLEQKIADLEADVAELTEQRDTAQSALDAIGALENTGFVVRQKAGRDAASAA